MPLPLNAISARGHWCNSLVGDFDPDDWFGYIYEIVCTINNRRYVGKKQFRFLRKKKPLKGRVNKRHSYVDSDWRLYTSSSKHVHNLIDSCGLCNFTFTIIKLCDNKSQLSYYETYFMIHKEVMTLRDASGELVYLNKQIPAVKCIPKL